MNDPAAFLAAERTHFEVADLGENRARVLAVIDLAERLLREREQNAVLRVGLRRIQVHAASVLQSAEPAWDESPPAEATASAKAAVKVDERPMLGPWVETHGGNAYRRVDDDGYARAEAWRVHGDWHVYTNDGMNRDGGRTGDLASAKLAADTAARRWYRLPEDAPAPPKPKFCARCVPGPCICVINNPPAPPPVEVPAKWKPLGAIADTWAYPCSACHRTEGEHYTEAGRRRDCAELPPPPAAHFTIALGESHYEVRHAGGKMTGGTLLETGRDVTPGELCALASRLGRMSELTARIPSAIEENCK